MSENERGNRTGSTEGLSAALRDLPDSDRTLLIVDDDAPLCQRLARAMERRGFVVATADSVAGGIAQASERPPAFAVVKAGAIDYLPKPADADAVERALLAREDGAPEPPEDPMSADRVRWEHIQRVFELCDRNVSETARRLKMHRRTLQRILSKHAPRS